jgi:hypothetical protein
LGSIAKEIPDVFGLQAGVFAELKNGYKCAFLFPVLFADLGKQFSSGPFFTAGNIHDVLCINDYAIWDRLLHNPAPSERLLFSF